MVVPLHVADVVFPDGHPQSGQAGSVFAFLVDHPDGAVLVDTGLGPAHPEIDPWYRPARRPLHQALAGAGSGRHEITAIVNTHLHFDHCGDNHLFPGVPIHVQRAERAAAGDPEYTIADFVTFPGARYVEAEGDVDLRAGIRLVATPGHTPGHQSVLVDRGAETVLIAGQAVYTAAEWDGETDPRRSGLESAWDRSRYAGSVRRLRDLRPDRVLFSHDPIQWQSKGSISAAR